MQCAGPTKRRAGSLPAGRRFVLSFSYSHVLYVFKGVHALPVVGLGYLFVKKKILRPTAGYEADEQSKKTKNVFLF